MSDARRNSRDVSSLTGAGDLPALVEGSPAIREPAFFVSASRLWCRTNEKRRAFRRSALHRAVVDGCGVEENPSFKFLTMLSASLPSAVQVFAGVFMPALNHTTLCKGGKKFLQI